MNVSVRIEYYGEYQLKTGRSFENFLVSPKLNEAYEAVMSHIKLNYGLMPPFILLFERYHIANALKNLSDKPVKDGATFKLMPFISGG